MSCCPGLAKCRNRWFKVNIRTPLPGMGGTFCLPISVENPAIATAPDVPDLALTPCALSQDKLAMGAHCTTSPNGGIGTLGAVVLFQPDPAAQGTERRSCITPGHATLGDVQTDNSEGIGLGTQVTVPTEDTDIDAPPNLTQIEMEDGGNGGGGGDPGAIAQGERGQEEGGMVRVRKIKGEEDLACQVLHPCDNQLIAVFGDSIHLQKWTSLRRGYCRQWRLAGEVQPRGVTPTPNVQPAQRRHQPMGCCDVGKGIQGLCMSRSGTQNAP